MRPLWGRLIVGFVLCLISFISYSSQIFIIWPWYGSELSVELITLLLPFNLLVGMLFWNYWLCVLTDPGRVPDNWKPDTHTDGVEVKKLTGTPRYCRVCDKYKPPRTHHCRSCNRCVLRMDHHCPWVNNCVGHFNYGHFIRFLFYVDLACSYHLLMVTKRVLGTGDGFWDEPSAQELVFIILNYVACVPVLLCVGIFSIYHFYCLLGNSTTIEGWEKDKAATMVRRGKIQEIKFPYNLGKTKNIQSILGKNPFLWCWPTRTPGTGLRYELADHDGGPVQWPPRDPKFEEDLQQNGAFTLADSPWTYENGSVNPDLKPYNSSLRQASSSKRRRVPGASALPPYHPDYEEGQEYVSSDSEVSSDDELPHPLLRRGSEGYEVQPLDRNAMLERYLRDLGEEPGRYLKYIPEPDVDSDDDDLPLSLTIPA